jgi:hypothetical protein
MVMMDNCQKVSGAPSTELIFDNNITIRGNVGQLSKSQLCSKHEANK